MITESYLPEIAGCIAIGYVLGNFNPSFLIARRKGYDARSDGSGNAGASNAFILAGKTAFFIVAILDILKAFATCRLCRFLFPDLVVAEQIGGVACILGHMFPALLGFRGGRGLACLGGVVLSWSWKWFLCLLTLAILIAFLSRYVCFVAPTISLLFPALYYYETRSVSASLILLIAAAPIILKHLENFARIRNGTEARISYLWKKDEELKRIGRSE